jgi:hypothetical protein
VPGAPRLKPTLGRRQTKRFGIERRPENVHLLTRWFQTSAPRSRIGFWIRDLHALRSTDASGPRRMGLRPAREETRIARAVAPPSPARARRISLGGLRPNGSLANSLSIGSWCAAAPLRPCLTMACSRLRACHGACSRKRKETSVDQGKRRAKRCAAEAHVRPNHSKS